ncbi:hypothetical protein VSR01_18990 [Actinacidiphila sp. DG2A-62]|uniref:DUF6879 family protein n=1 Tax=Actinacidiphila sp. DG2A-62 TaxID=3108821 RepID=UPI002DB8330B|nr:DUF6879 family protein [Actinacidiphila sp. DG2A-62]MEC3995500.1 hypothetical protein [Actinacidiphila sp. DG2A-62]
MSMGELGQLHAPALPEELGQRLERPGYKRDFRERREVIRDAESWKLERLQHFEEDSPARDALRRGDWAGALRLFEARRNQFRGAAETDRLNNAPFRRLRVVEEPLTPYMQWELHSLHVRAQAGNPSRVISAKDVAAAETDKLLPEVVILGGRTLYRVLYSEAGASLGAIRFTDPEIIEPWVAYISRAYAVAEDIQDYFARAVAHLPPPPAA